MAEIIKKRWEEDEYRLLGVESEYNKDGKKVYRVRMTKEVVNYADRKPKEEVLLLSPEQLRALPQLVKEAEKRKKR